MRQAALRHLPQATAEKEKLGFPVPTRVWLRDEHYYTIVKDLFTSPTAEKFFNTDVLVDYLDEHFIEKEDNSRKIWTIYVFLVWYQIYFGIVEAEEEDDVITDDPTQGADSPFEDESDEQEASDGKTRVFHTLNDTPVAQGNDFEDEDDDIEFEEIYSQGNTKTAKSVNISLAEQEDDDEDTQQEENENAVKPSFKPTLENHNDFFENLKSQLQDDDTAVEPEESIE